MSRFARLALWLPLLAAACVLPPDDPFERGEFAVQRDDLLMALQAYDAVPVAHPRYPAARAAAVEVERRMRRCQELLLEALMLRGEWRDEEALETLRKAQVQWPRQPGLDRWIRATEQRLALFGTRRPQDVAERAEVAAPSPAPLVEVAPTEPASVEPPVEPVVEVATPESEDPVVELPSEPAALSPQRSAQPVLPTAAPVTPVAVPVEDAKVVDGAETPRSAGSRLVPPAVVEPKPKPTPEPPAESPASAVRPRLGEDPVALGLVAVERQLARRDRAAAMRDLTELARRFPGDVRVTRRLGRLLHQRALLHYGQGAVAAAIRDWQRVLELEPDNERVQRLLAVALREAEQRGPQ